MKNFLTRANDKDFGLSFFDNVFDDFFRPTFYTGANSHMKTDVKSTDAGYEISIDMPGYDKKDVSVEFDRGYLTVSAKREENESEGEYVKRERSFSCRRTYFVGDEVEKESIKAKYENGVLSLSVPKTIAKELPSKNIQID